MTTEVENKTEEKVTLKGLKDTIISELKSHVAETVKSEVAPFKEQATSWMEKIRATGNEKTVMEKGTKGIGAARFVRALAAGKGDPDRAINFAKKAWTDDLGNVVQKALTAGSFTGAGALIPPEMASEVIELLRAKVVVRAAGARVVPMPRGTITLRKHTGTSTATYIGESQDISQSAPTVGQITLTAKKLAGIVPISNDLLLYDADVTADMFVRDDLVATIADKEDVTFLYGTGTEDSPRGIRYWVTNDNLVVSAGTTATNIETDFKNCLNALETKNAPMRNPVWIMNPRSKNHLANLRDANGNLIYPEMRVGNGSLYGFPVYTTTNVPINLGSGTATEVFFVDMCEILIGESSSLEIAVDSSASYIESGSLVSAFSRDETLMRAIERHDLGVRHADSIAILKSITWGA
jgi:HK97 family phage major capsid protein